MPVHVALALMLLNLPLKLWAEVFCSSVRVNFTERNFNSVLLIVYCLVRALLTLFPQHNSHLWTVPLVEFEVTVLHITVWPLWVLLSMACVGSVIGLLYHAVESWRTNINNRVRTSPNCNSTALTVAACLLTVLSVAHILFASTFIYQQWGEDYWFPLGIALVGLPGVFLVVQSLVQTVFICHCLCFTDQLADIVLPQLKWHKHMNFIFSWNTLLLLAVACSTQSTSDTLFTIRIILSLFEVFHRIFCGILFHHLQENVPQVLQAEVEEATAWNSDTSGLVLPYAPVIALFYHIQMNVGEVDPYSDETMEECESNTFAELALANSSVVSSSELGNRETSELVFPKSSVKPLSEVWNSGTSALALPKSSVKPLSEEWNSGTSELALHSWKRLFRSQTLAPR